MKFDTNYEGGSGGIFLKLGDGEAVTGVFRGEPFDWRQHWLNGKGIACTGKGCQHCETDKASFRFKINFVVNENGAMTPKIFESGWGFYESLKSLQETGYNLERTTVRLHRSGLKTDTKYTVVPVPNGEINDEVEGQISQIKLLDLKPKNLDQAMDQAASDKSWAGEKLTTDDIRF